MNINNKGLRALTTSQERKELRAVGVPGPIRLQYLKGSEKMSMVTMKGEYIDCRLWNVLSPALPGYPQGPHNGFPTLGIEGLRKVELI